MARKKQKRHRKRRPGKRLGKINAQLRMKLERQNLERMARKESSSYQQSPRQRVQSAANEVDEMLERLGALLNISGGSK